MGKTKRGNDKGKTKGIKKQRAGYGSVARTRGAAVTGEMKYYDADLTSMNITATTTTWPAGTMQDPSSSINLGSAAVANPGTLCAPTVGSALNQRVGRDIKVLKCRVRGMVSVAAQSGQNTADAASTVRLMLVLDTQSNASQMTGAQLMNDGSAANTTLQSMQNPNNFGRFKVLKEKIFSMGNTALAGSPTAADLVSAGMRRPFKFNYKWRKPLVVRFNATNGGTVADIIDNSLHFVAATDATALAPQVCYYSRVGYKE